MAGGSLPAGLVLNTATGEITGIPTAIGTSSFAVFVQTPTQQCIKAFTIEVIAVSVCVPFSDPVIDTLSSNGNISSANWEITETGPSGTFSDAVIYHTYTGDAATGNFSIDITSNIGNNEFICEVIIHQSGSVIPSTVLLSVGPFTTSQDIDFAIPALPDGLYDTIRVFLIVRPGDGNPGDETAWVASFTCA